MLIDTLEEQRGKINLQRIFWALVAFELLALAIFFIGDQFYFKNIIFYVYWGGALLVPLFLLVTPIEPVVGLQLMFITTGLDFLARITKSTGSVNFNFTYFHLALLLTFISTFFNLLLKRRTVIRSTNLWMPLIMFYLVLAMSLIYTPNFPDGAMTFVRIVVMGLIALIVIESVDTIKKLKFVLWGMILIPAGISILTIYQLMTQGSFYASKVTKLATSLGIAVYRSTGTFDNPNKLACFLMIGIIVPFGLIFEKKLSRTVKLILASAILLSSVGILTTFSRAGWVSTLFGLALIVAINKKWSFYVIFVSMVVLMALVMSIKMPQLREAVFDRFTSIFDPSSDSSSSSRLSLIKSGIWMWQDHPVLGVGIRGFPTMYYDYVDPHMPQILLEVNEPHTLFFEILAEEGLVGLIIAVWLFMTIFAYGVKTSLKMNNYYLRLAQGTCTALYAAYHVNFALATDLTNNTFWMTVGLMYAIPFLDKKATTVEDVPVVEAGSG